MAKSTKGKKDEEKKGKEKSKQLPTTKQLDDAPSAIVVMVDGQQVTGTKKEFSTGSTGWNANGKVVIGGLQCQVSCNVTIIGSKMTK